MAAVQLSELPTLFCKYRVSRKVLSRISIWNGDITRIAVDAIVNAANTRLAGGGGVDGAIHRAAGYKELKAETSRYNGCAVGDAVITSGCNIPHIKHIIHTVGPQVFVDVTQEKRELLISCYRKSLELALKNGLTSIAFCCISTGVYGYPNREAAKNVVDFLLDYLSDDDENIDKIERIVIVTFLDVDKEHYEYFFGKYVADLSESSEGSPPSEGSGPSESSESD